MLKGIHHITALARDAERTFRFYTERLGLHLVKHTVNPDDPHTRLLTFGDAQGSPGSLLSFLLFPRCQKARLGRGSVERIWLQVPEGSLSDWASRLKGASPKIAETWGSPVLLFRDPDGLDLGLVATDLCSSHGSVGILHGLSLCSTGSDFWRESLVLDSEQPGLLRCGPQVLECLEYGEEQGGLGYGGVHHVAFSSELTVIPPSLEASPVYDRVYYRSCYFYAPSSLLCELATEEPGVSVDEVSGSLGGRLCLPPWLEGRREEIEEALPPWSPSKGEKEDVR